MTERRLRLKSCPESYSTLQCYLYHAAQATLPEFPGGNAALYIINQLLARLDGSGPLHNHEWDRLSDDVTAYLDDSLQPDKLRIISGYLNGIRPRYTHCQTGTTKTAKTICLHQLFVTMLGEGEHFKGRTLRERSLLLKYFDRFTMLFNSLTQELRTSLATHPPTNGEINIEETFRDRQCDYYKHLCRSKKLTEQIYGCRHIHVRLTDTTPIFDRDEGYAIPPPNML